MRENDSELIDPNLKKKNLQTLSDKVNGCQKHFTMYQ
jgi:hypothetical protein